MYTAMQQPLCENHYDCLHCCKFLPQYITTCLGIRNATHWADARSIERISCLSLLSVTLTNQYTSRKQLWLALSISASISVHIYSSLYLSSPQYDGKTHT